MTDKSRDDFEKWWKEGVPISQDLQINSNEKLNSLRKMMLLTWTAAAASQEKRAVPDKSFEGIICEKISCAKGKKLFRTTIEIETFCLDNLEPEARYSVKFYRIGDKAGEE